MFRNVIENYTSHGSTVNVCSIDLSKAFDRMNHYALYIKLMKRGFPVALLALLEKWFELSPVYGGIDMILNFLD